MTTNKQIEANRQNALMSTGPRTEAGKSRSRLNSWKHGLTANMLIIVGENADDFDEFRAKLLEEQEPQSALEAEQVERLAVLSWRLRRVPFYEAALLDARQFQVEENKRQEDPYPPVNHRYEEDEDETGEEGDHEDEEMSDLDRSIQFGQTLIQDLAYGDGLGKMTRHETSLMNNFMKTLATLRDIQESRSNFGGPLIEGAALPPKSLPAPSAS